MLRSHVPAWWLLVVAAVGAAPAVVLLQSVGSDRAGAQASEVTLSRQQLIINQRISQAAVRRGNRALERLPLWAVVLADGRSSAARATSA
ncbi:MAG TPA: hypothetical protein VNT51_08545 [Miltoncostaeaceae bacterium]|nr:hypothetical protein [Miltoncostaeaceae bacterium]